MLGSGPCTIVRRIDRRTAIGRWSGHYIAIARNRCTEHKSTVLCIVRGEVSSTTAEAHTDWRADDYDSVGVLMPHQGQLVSVSGITITSCITDCAGMLTAKTIVSATFAGS